MQLLARSFLLATMSLAVAALAGAQVPEGWYITAHIRTSAATGGLYLHHPTGAVPTITVSGLPAALTGLTPWNQFGNSGANAVAILPDGTIAVGHVSGLGFQPLDLYHLSLSVNIAAGTAVATVLQTIPLGVGSGGLRAQIAEIEVTGSNEVVLAVSTLGTGPLAGSGPLSGARAGCVDLATGVATPIAMIGATGAANAITSDGINVWVGTGINNQLYLVPKTGGNVLPLMSPSALITNLALDAAGSLICTLGARHEIRNPVTGALIASCSSCGGAAMDLEDATGDLIVLRGNRIDRLPWCTSCSLVVTGLIGNVAGIDVAQNPDVFGAPSPAGGPDYRWQVAPTVTGLPVLGTMFQVDVEPQAGPYGVFNVWAASLGRNATPFPIAGLGAWINLAPGVLLGQGPLAATAAGGRFSFLIPANPSFRGIRFYLQSVHVQPNNTLAASDGLCFALN